MTSSRALEMTHYLLLLSLSVQSFEMLSISKKIGEATAWDWKHVRADFQSWPHGLRSLLDWLFAHHFQKIIYLQILGIALFLVLPHWSIAVGLMLSNVLINLRFRGIFNGGSDYMTMLQLLGLALALFPTKDGFGILLGLYYIALQTTISYFVAGLVKARASAWRKGFALEVFLGQSNYPVPNHIRQWARKPLVSLPLSWMVILWECLFPVVWLLPSLTVLFLGVGALFHLGIFFSFGLNRFVFAWLASYPALYFATHHCRL